MNVSIDYASPGALRRQHPSRIGLICSIVVAALLGMIGVGSLPFAPTAQAQSVAPGNASNWPQRPIRMIVPNGSGGLPDIVARLTAQKLSESLGQQVIVENRVGAGSTLGTAAAVRAAADGYTLLAVFDSHVTNPHLFKKLDYDTLNDLAPISLLTRGPMMLLASGSFAANNLNDLVQLAKAKPGAVNFAVVGPGSPARLLMEALKLAAGIDVTMIAYKSAGLAMGELASGQVDVMFATVPTAASFVKSARVKVLALTSDKRSNIAPGMPTMSESIPGFGTETWVGLLAPAKTSPELIARINAESIKALTKPDMQARLAEQGLEAVGSTPKEFDAFIRNEMARWGKIIREQKITLE